MRYFLRWKRLEHVNSTVSKTIERSWDEGEMAEAEGTGEWQRKTRRWEHLKCFNLAARLTPALMSL